MGTQPKSAPRITFGPFEYDGSAGELRRHQTKLRLTGQPLRILEVLLERPNQVVDREELQQRLWNGTTFVDFEHGLNAAVNKLRQILGDSADQPRYIETLPGRGYRFVGALSYSSPRPLLEMVPAASSDPAEGSGPVEAAAGSERRLPRRLAAVLGVSLLAAVSLSLALHFTPSPSGRNSPRQTVRVRVAIPEGMELSGSQTFSLSPDGRTLIYHARTDRGSPFRLWAQSLDSLEPRAIADADSYSDSPVFWSPDSKFVAVYREGKLQKLDLRGNPAQVIGPVPGNVLGGSWNSQGTIIFGSETGGILRISAKGGEPVPVTIREGARSERLHLFPTFLPDGRHFLYSRRSSAAENTGVFIGSLDVRPEDQSLKRLIATPFAPQFVASPDGAGVLLFQRETTLWAQDFDTSHLRLMAEPRQVAEHVGSSRAFGFFSSSSGALVHRDALTEVGQLAWFGRSGKHLSQVGQPEDLWEQSPQISPDGARVAVTKADGGNVDVWVHDLGRDVTQRITLDPAIDVSPIWSPDGKRIAFSSSRAGHYDLYVIGANGEGREELLYESSENKVPTSWSADGRFLLYSTERGSANPGVWLLPLEGTGKHRPVPLLNSQANERNAVFSPDSRWIAYVSNASGKPEVYVQPFVFPDRGSESGPKVLISRGGGIAPHWRADGKELFYRTLDGMLMSATMTSVAELHPAVPRSLFHLGGNLWTATGDGTRFLLGLPINQGAPPFTLVLNWQAEWKR
jgi:eukaryotic-like serine/threonine-protein kinase